MGDFSSDNKLQHRLENVGSFKDLFSIILECMNSTEVSQIDVMPFVKAYATLLLESDAYYRDEDERHDAGLCAYELGKMNQTNLKNSSDSQKALFEECIDKEPDEVLLNHCSSCKDLFNIIKVLAPYEEDLKKIDGDRFAEILLALEPRIDGLDEEQQSEELSAFINAKDAIMQMDLYTMKSKMLELEVASAASFSKRETIILIVIIVLLIAYFIWSYLHPESATE